jgi:hypothetical protein
MVFLLLFVSTLWICVSQATSNAQIVNYTPYFGHFTYRGNVSYSDQSLLVYEIVAVEADVSLRYCAAECHKNLDCNAVEMCSTATGNVCRISRKISTSLTSGKDTCSRYELVWINIILPR